MSRLDAGDYWMCEQCGAPIAAERLAARPAIPDLHQVRCRGGADAPTAPLTVDAEHQSAGWNPGAGRHHHVLHVGHLVVRRPAHETHSFGDPVHAV